MSDCPPGCRVNFNILNFIFVLNYAYLSSWLFIVVNVGWRYVRSKGRFGLTHVLFRKKTYFQCCSWIFWGYDDFERKLVFLFCHLAISGRWQLFWKFLRFILWEIQDLCSKSEGQSQYLTLFLLLEGRYSKPFHSQYLLGNSSCCLP